MALSDATNVGALASTALAAPVKSASPSSAPPAMAAPNAEKLAAALDDVAGVDAAARDAAESKLDAASAKDAPGLCAALLAIAADPACVPARRLAAATFARNILRKAWGARDADADVDAGPRIPPDARPAVRAAALSALVAAPADARRLLADCLRLASTSAARDARDESASASASDAPSALVDDVVAAAANIPGTLPPGLLLAAHVAALPFQYFRDLTVAREAPPPALERLCFDLVAPRVIPALRDAAFAPASKDAAQEARVAFKTLYRLVRAHMPEALRSSLRDVACAIDAVARAVESAAEKNPEKVSETAWIATKRGMRLGAALVSRHAASLDETTMATIVGAARRVASLAPGVATPPAAAAAFATLAAVVECGDAGAYDALTTSDGPDDDASRIARLSALVRECVVPHVSLTDADREMLAEDPEEYARVHACGEAAEEDAAEEALDGSSGGGVTARRAALDFVAALVAARAPGSDAAGTAKSSTNKRSAPTLGEIAAKTVVDELLAACPKEKVEKVSKSAAAAGATATLVAPAAEEALGESAYFGLLALHGALAAAAAEEGRPAKESATRTFCRSHAFPAAAAAASPHVAVAAAAHCASIAAQMNAAPLAREALNALVASMERDAAEDEDEDARAVTRDAASWAARAVLLDAPCASEAFGATAVGAVDAAAERLVSLVESAPARAAPPLRTLAALADAASGAMVPSAAANLARRVVHAFAPFAPQEGDDETGDDETGDVDPDGEMTLDAWDASVDAAASLADAVEEGECPGDENASERANLAAKMALAGDVARHVRAYWRTAAALEDGDEEDEDEDEEDEDAGSPRTSPRTSSDAPAPAHAAHASLANLVRFACESIAEAVEKKASVAAADAEAVWSAAGAWASYLPAWRLAGDDAADDAAFEAAAAMVASASAAGASASALAAMTAPTAAAAAAVIEESDDAVARRAAARALAAVVAVRPETVSADASVVDAAKSLAEAAAGRRSARAAAHLLVAVAAASPAAFENDPAAWMRLREETAATAGWLATDADPGALLGAHVAAAKAALAAAVAPGADAPDKRRFGAILAEAMLGAAALLAPEDEGEDGDDGEDADDEDADDEDADDSDADSDSDADADDAFNETEAEMLERYAAIAREMAEGGSGGDDDDEGADGAGLAEEDEAFESALEPGHGDGKAAARAFVEWYAAWKKAGSSGMRVVSLVDPATVKTFHTRAGVA